MAFLIFQDITIEETPTYDARHSKQSSEIYTIEEGVGKIDKRTLYLKSPRFSQINKHLESSMAWKYNEKSEKLTEDENIR